MSTSHQVEDGCTCPHCTNKTLTITYNEASGYEWQDSECSTCGYIAKVDLDCGGNQEESTWSTNKIDGLIISGNNREFTVRLRIPGSIVGAKDFSEKTFADWIIFVTPSSVESIRGDLREDKFDEVVTSARQFLSSMKLLEQTNSQGKSLMPQKKPVTEFNVGAHCLSEDDCIEQGIDFRSYEKGVSHAAIAFATNNIEAVLRENAELKAQLDRLNTANTAS